MNVQKIFDALTDDQDNSAHGIICTELENQDYQVKIYGKQVTGKGFFEGEFTDIEKLTESLEISLLRDGQLDQEFIVEFIDFHEIIIKQKGI